MINEERAQGATEMLIILAGVILIALLVALWLFGPDGIGSQINNEAGTATNNTINAINGL
ncbi:MAG: hypothetical protein V1672_02175 [Candidatus Diapherotrites archaeon]